MTAYSTAPLPSSSRRRPIRAAIGGLLALGLGLAGCSAGTAGAEPTRVAAPAAFPVEIDEPGAAEAVVIEEEPNRITVLSPDAAIALHEIGATERVIAIPDAATSATLNPHAEQMADVEHVIGGHTSPEPEQVLAWDPDLVVVTARHTGEQDASERLSAAGVPVLTLMNGWSTSDAVAENIEILGRATGLSDAADALADEIVGGVADIRERAEGAGEQPTVAILSNQAQTPFINAGSSLVADIVANGGGASAAAQIGIDKTMPVQPEQLVAMDPDCIMLVDVTGKGEASFDELLAHPAIAALPAVADDRVALFPGRQMYGSRAARWSRRASACSSGCIPISRNDRCRAPLRLGSDPARVPVLAPRLVRCDGCGVRKIERPHVGAHRDPQTIRDARIRQRLVGQSRRLGPEQQRVARLVGDVGERARRVTGERVDPSGAVLGEMRAHRIEVGVHDHVREVVIIEPRPAQVRIGEVEPEGLDEVQRVAGDRRHSDRVSRVRRDAGLVEDDVEHVLERSANGPRARWMYSVDS